MAVQRAHQVKEQLPACLGSPPAPCKEGYGIQGLPTINYDLPSSNRSALKAVLVSFTQYCRPLLQSSSFSAGTYINHKGLASGFIG